MLLVPLAILAGIAVLGVLVVLGRTADSRDSSYSLGSLSPERPATEPEPATRVQPTG